MIPKVFAMVGFWGFGVVRGGTHTAASDPPTQTKKNPIFTFIFQKL